MNASKPIHIFRPGKHTAMSGVELEFTEHHLAMSAAAYNPALHEAPLVVGHPKADAPAYGWVKALQFADGGLHAEPEQVDAAFAELVQAGRFKKISASFYPPESSSNPVPGVYYLRHVGFLGAQPPAVKGLKNAEFADESDCVTIEFSEYDDLTVAGLFRGLREWLIGKFGTEDADAVVPNYAVQQLEQSANREIAEEQSESAQAELSPSFTESIGDDMSDADKQRLTELEAENARLKQQQIEFAEREKKSKSDALHAENVAFAENLIKSGQLLPAQKSVTVALLDFMAGQDEAIEFGEGDDKAPLLEKFKTTVLAALPKQIEFGEIGAGGHQQPAQSATSEEIAVATQLGIDPAEIVKQRGKNA